MEGGTVERGDAGEEEDEERPIVHALQKREKESPFITQTRWVGGHTPIGHAAPLRESQGQGREGRGGSTGGSPRPAGRNARRFS